MWNQKENKKVLYIDANNVYGRSMPQPLPYDENRFDKDFKKENILNKPDDNGIGYLIEYDINCPDEMKQKLLFFSFSSWK